MRIVLIGAVSAGLGAALADHLDLDHVHRPDEITRDAFVLEGWPRDLREAIALDAALSRRAADVDVVLWLRGSPSTPRSEAVLDHYRGRIVEFEGGADSVESALDGIREALLVG